MAGVACKNNQKIAISRAWYNGSYTMAVVIALDNDPVFNNKGQPTILDIGGRGVIPLYKLCRYV